LKIFFFKCRVVKVILCQLHLQTQEQLHLELTTSPTSSSFFSGRAEELGTILRAYPEIFHIQRPSGQKVSLNRVKHSLACGLLGLASNISVSKACR
jgi:hypothetical protein